MADSLISRASLQRDLESIHRDTMYEERFRQGYLHCWGIVAGILGRAHAVEPVQFAEGVRCWGCESFDAKAGICKRTQTPATPQDFCSFGVKKERG